MRKLGWLTSLAMVGACAAPNAPPADAVTDAAAVADEAALDAASVDAVALPPLPDVLDPATAPTPTLRLRRTLGIPDEARRVLVFGQNSHMDLDWLRTQEGYYTGYVEQIYSMALDFIAADPAYRYATAEMGFLRMYYERRPERREALVRALREGRFQVVGGGVSQPDVLIPTGENLLRDYQQGARWLASIGAARTRAAYLPDSFGLGASTPDVLRAAGFDAVAFWRADGSSDVPEFNASVADFARLPVAAGSTAAQLRADNAIDFLWEGPGGARVFAHWLTNGYMFGDYLDYRSIAYRQYGRAVGLVLRDPELVAPNIETYLSIMAPQSPTDFMFVPIGGDFVYPKANLARIAEHWNRTRLARTGVWVHAGTFAEFSALALTQSERLRTRRIDVLPYWMGFFASRPALKDLARRGSAALDQAHKALSLLRALGLPADATTLADAEWTAGATNHHDWVTGTSVDPVTADEQMPRTRAMYDRALAVREGAVEALARALPRPTGALAGEQSVAVFNSESYARAGIAAFSLAVPAPASARSVLARTLDEAATPVPAQLSADRTQVLVSPASVPSLGYLGLRVALRDEAATDVPAVALVCKGATGSALPCDDPGVRTVEATTAELALRFDLTRGGALTSLRTGGVELLDGGAFELLVYEDAGGLYTFGHEGGGRFSQGFIPGMRAAGGRATLAVREQGPVRTVLEVRFEAQGVAYAVDYVVPARGAHIDATITARTAPGTALLARFGTALTASDALMAVPAGAMRRPVGGRHAPTFVPFEQWFAYEDADRMRGVTLSAPANPAVTYDAQGTVDLVLHRNAPTSDRGPNGLGGSTNDAATLRVRLSAYARGRTRTEHYGASSEPWFPLLARAAGTGATGVRTVPPSGSLLRVEGEALVSALRIPSDGEPGAVLRLLRTSDSAPTARVLLDALSATSALRTDATELGGTPVAGFARESTVALDGAYTTLRVR